jgi:hypothetical protein
MDLLHQLYLPQQTTHEGGHLLPPSTGALDDFSDKIKLDLADNFSKIQHERQYIQNSRIPPCPSQYCGKRLPWQIRDKVFKVGIEPPHSKAFQTFHGIILSQTTIDGILFIPFLSQAQNLRQLILLHSSTTGELSQKPPQHLHWTSFSDRKMSSFLNC